MRIVRNSSSILKGKTLVIIPNDPKKMTSTVMSSGTMFCTRPLTFLLQNMNATPMKMKPIAAVSLICEKYTGKMGKLFNTTFNIESEGHKSSAVLCKPNRKIAQPRRFGVFE